MRNAASVSSQTQRKSNFQSPIAKPSSRGFAEPLLTSVDLSVFGPFATEVRAMSRKSSTKLWRALDLLKAEIDQANARYGAAQVHQT